ncbi:MULTISPECIES: DNA cytosine methyltransferase [Staphylococcus]|nr:MULTISPECIES: DNA cytosine methyltransferase [Staphylococcus]MBM6508016.1 DNA cytosine methyltransferase [Staphylococcus pasteuri]PTU81872.1 DNA (cytosine-5-)-methyltransferase [Staphylococcus pasteuri]QQT20072.1 DNA cytosine methyltransferase [Staphylococcus pasteuri]RIO38007.1 DNA cytosine methyltransferase [Staphylococcus pasteuri]VXC86072.1 DNA cytosine methyltransferase [Staphylococcus sp. 8AQ]
MNIIDLFSGVGGFSNGFIQTNDDVILANEIDCEIAKSYLHNHPDTLMINESIEDFAKDINKAINCELKKIKNENRRKEISDKLKNVDVIIGGPPCQGFSMSGNRIRKKKEFIEDPRNYLFKYYYKILKYFNPDFFVFENVQGLLTMEKGLILEEILKIFSEKSNDGFPGYNVDYHIIDSSLLGVPQKRKRLFIIGSKNSEINLRERLNEYIKYNEIDKVNLKDAISDLNYLNSGEGKFESSYELNAQSVYQEKMRNKSYKLFNHIVPKHDNKTLKRIEEVLPGKNFKDLKDADSIKSVHSGAYGRLEWGKPAYTITTRFDTPSAGRVIHPDLNRTLTAREAARIQSFSDDFIFIGNKSSIGKQIGNAVPPLVAKAISEIIHELKRY